MITRRQFLASAGILGGTLAVRKAAALPLARTTAIATNVRGDYAHPEWLVESTWLANRLTDPMVKVIGIQPAKEFATAHIPGAVTIETGRLAIAKTDQASLADWRTSVASAMTDLGISRFHTVVVYDGGNLHAARLWWALDQIGHADKRILDGGLPAWSQAGFALAGGPDRATAAGQPYAVVPNDAAVASIDEVIASFTDGSAVFIDARDTESYAKGHIPGALSIPIEANAATDGPRFWKPATELNALYGDLRQDTLIIPYCGGGVRASATYFALRELGYDNVALFTGSWSEWSAHKELPVAVGDRP